jgi:hypothetical protein
VSRLRVYVAYSAIGQESGRAECVREPTLEKMLMSGPASDLNGERSERPNRTKTKARALTRASELVRWRRAIEPESLTPYSGCSCVAVDPVRGG